MNLKNGLVNGQLLGRRISHPSVALFHPTPVCRRGSTISFGGFGSIDDQESAFSWHRDKVINIT